MSQHKYNNVKIIIYIFLVIISVTSCSLSFSRNEYKRGLRAKDKMQFQKAIDHFETVMTRYPDSQEALFSAREAALISEYEIKNYKQALKYYEFIRDNTREDQERRNIQKLIAKIYLEKLSNFEKARAEINKLLILRNNNEDTIDLRLDLAKAEFNLNNFEEAEKEIQQALKIVEDKEKKFELLIFLGSILFNSKKTDQAIQIYEEVKKLSPDRAKKENIDMNIVVCYEDAENFDKAIEKLQMIRDSYTDKEFIDLKIDRLKSRKANQPGSKGLRK